jgi:hypothetical protein
MGRPLAGAALLVMLAVPAHALEPVRETLPGSVVRQPQDPGIQAGATRLDATVTRETTGTDVSAPPRPVSPYRLPPKKAGKAPGDLEALNMGWQRLGDADPQAALAAFEAAAASKDRLLAQEANLGKAYALWRLGREAQAEGIFKSLVEQDFRVPEVLPNLLILLRKRGAKAVEPYLKYLPEDERDTWRK